MISILRGEGGAVRHQRGRMHFHRPQGGCMVFAAKGGIKNGARKGAHLASAAVLYNYPGRSPEPACKAMPITGRTLGAQGRQALRRHQPSSAGVVNLREYSFPPIPSQKPAATIVEHSKKNINPAAKGGIKNGARKGAHLASAAVLYNYPGRSPEPACKAMPITGRTLGAQGRQARRRHEPSAPRGCQPLGIQRSTE